MDHQFPCKFSDKGCKEVGARSSMKDHIRCCIIGKIECPSWTCNDMILRAEIVNHLKNTHGAPAYTKGTKLNWSVDQQGESVTFGVGITFAHGHTFFLNCVKIKYNTLFWVSILGSEKQAEIFQVQMAAGPHDDLCIRMPGKVYSSDIGKEDVLKDPRGILDIGRNMADKMPKWGDGKLRIPMAYDITCSAGKI